MLKSFLRALALRASTTGAILPQLLIALVGAGLLGTAVVLVRADSTVEAVDLTAGVTDTVVVYGPRRFDATGSTANFLERLSFPRVPGRRYVVRLENGAADGSARVTSGALKLNGWELIPATGFTAGIAKTEKPGAFRGSDTTAVTLTGAVGSYATMTVLSVADPSVGLFGPVQYTIVQGTSKDHDTTFTLSAAAAPYTLTVLNGDSLGNHRTASATLEINGVRYLSPADFNQNVGTVTASVSLGASNFFHLRLPGEPEGFVVVSITGTDNTPPVLTVTSPANNFLTRDTLITVTGTVQDQTQVQVTVNGVVASVSGTNWSASVPLTIEGANTLLISALDANGLHTDSSRVVKRDTHAPTLAVSTPAVDGYTHDTTVVVTGTASDASSFTVNLNGTPLTVDSLGHFTRTVSLTEGVNVLVVTATDAVGNTGSIARTLRRDTQAPALAVTTPAGTVYTRDSSYAVNGTATDASTLSVTVNGVVVTLDSAGAWTRTVDLVTEGVNVVTVVATDASGLASTEVRTIIRDTHAPGLLVATPAPDVFTHDTSYLVTGSVTDANLVSLTVNGTTVTPDSAGNWSQVVALGSEGANVITAVATDAAGGVSTVTRTLTRDTQAPTLVVAAPADSSFTKLDSTVVSGTAADATPVTVTVNGVNAAVDSTGHWSLVTGLSVEGANTITVVATDASGLTAATTRTVLRDTHAPTLAITNPASGFLTQAGSVTISGTVNDSTPVTLTVNGTAVTPNGSGAWSLVVALSEGSNSIAATATDAAGNVSATSVSVTRDSQAPVITLQGPDDGITTTDASVTVSGTVADASGSASVTVNGSPATVAGGAFSTSVALIIGSNTITVSASDAAGNSSSDTRTVTRTPAGPQLPPDPATVAPALDQTVATNTFTSTSFLYTGANPIQTGVFPGTITLTRAAVVRGAVMSRDGTPLSGVAVSLRGRPEYGQTLTRVDGQFDFALNGGGAMIFDFAKEGYLPSQRVITAEWQEWTVADTVALVPLDTAVTHISFTQPIEVARGSVVTDSVGTRQGTLLFKQGTSATMVMSDGSTQPLSALDVRVSEYTVGANGRAAMPGELPPATAYTYAAEMSVDAALAAGATSVTFSQPVSYYLDNYRDFPVGTVVPAGWYDRTAGLWRPEPDGRVIKIVGVNAGVAAVSVEASELAASQATLDSLGITTAERTKLAELYSVGKTLWWTPLSHFSPWDLNMGWHFVGFVGGPVPFPLFVRNPDTNPTNCPGSIICVQNQTLGEDLAISGTPYALHYESDRMSGYTVGRSITIPAVTAVDTIPLINGTRNLQRNEAPTTVVSAYYILTVAGKRYVRGPFSVFNMPATTITWDGKDAAGRVVNGKVRGTLEVQYWFPAAYGYATTFGASTRRSFGTAASTGGAVRMIPYMPRVMLTTVELEGNDARGSSFGGWTLNVQHRYTPVTGDLWLGDGTRRNAKAIGARVRSLFTPRPSMADMLTDAAGMVYIQHASGFNHVVYRYDPMTGARVRVAGDTVSNFGFSGDGGPATSAKMNSPAGIALAPDGTLYISDRGNNRIRQVKNGIITTIAGNGTNTNTGDGGLASAATVTQASSLVVGPDGSLFIGVNGNRIRRISPDGYISTYVGTGVSGYPVDGSVAANTPITIRNSPIAMGRDGSLYFMSPQADQFNNQGVVAIIYRMSPDGRLYRFAGHRPTESLTGLTPARLLYLSSNSAGSGVGDFEVDAQGRLLLTHAATVYRISQDGSYEILAGIGRTRCVLLVGGTCDPLTAPDNFAAVTQPLEGSGLLAVLPDGRILTNGAANKIFAIENPLPDLGPTEILVASEDGSEVYNFNQYGRHLRTLDAFTRDTLIEFTYDSAGRVTAVKDADGLVTSFQRTNGLVTAVTGPYGQRTLVTHDASGYLRTLTDEGGQGVTLTMTAGGLLQGLRRSGEGTHTFGFDGQGRLTSDSDPSGRTQTLTRVETDSSTVTVLADALGRKHTVRIDQVLSNRRRVTTTDEAGLVSVSTAFENDSSVATGPDGTVVTSVLGSDSRFGPQATVLRRTTTTTPSGLVATMAGGRSVALSNPADPLSVVSATDSAIVNGRVYRKQFTRATRTVVTTAPSGRSITEIYDADGRLSEDRTPGFPTTTFEYDAQGRMKTVRSGTREFTYDYDARGRARASTDPLGRRDSLAYDSTDRPIMARTADGRRVEFEYDSAGKLIAITPPGRPAYTMTYDTAGRLRTLKAPAVGTEPSTTTVAYAASGDLASIHRADGRVIAFSQDTFGRPSRVSFDRGAVEFGYQSTSGRLIHLSAPGGNTLDFAFDGSLPTSVTWSGEVNGTVSSGYDTDFRVNSQKVNGNYEVGFTYDPDGQLLSAGTFGISRDLQSGRPIADSLGLMRSAYVYDTFGQLAGMVATVGADTLLLTGYERDLAGRITRLVERSQGVTHESAFSYDSAGRLATVSRDSVLSATYVYDVSGNRLSRATPSGSITSTFDAQDRLLTSGSASYSYNASGDLGTKVVGLDTTRYHYDALGNLVDVRKPDGTVVEYLIDAQNRRIGRKLNGVLERAWLYQGQLTPVAELDGAGNVVSRFVYALGVNSPTYMMRGGHTYRFIKDHLGSVRFVVDVASGDVVQRLSYDEFGVETENTNPGWQPFGYAGGMVDPLTGLVRFGVRDYDPSAGRWTTKDPIGFGSGQFNLYAYVGNQPITRVDPSGFCYSGDRYARNCTGLINAHQSTMILRAARESGEWTYSWYYLVWDAQGDPFMPAKGSTHLGDCTDFTLNAVVQGLDVRWRGSKVTTRGFADENGHPGYSQIDPSCARPGDIVVWRLDEPGKKGKHGGHAGIVDHVTGGVIYGLANNGSTSSGGGESHDRATRVIEFSTAHYGDKGKIMVFRPIVP